MGRYTEGGIGRDVIAGAAAGVAAIWVANKLDDAMYRRGSAKDIAKTEAARPGGMDPAHVLAKRAADAVGVDVGNPKDNIAGHTIDYGIAACVGALYGLMRGVSPAVTAARGSMFGVTMFVLKDEIGNAALGTAGNPLHYPVRDHARGLAAHAVFGVVTDLFTRLIAPWRDEVIIVQGPPLAERVDQGRAYLADTRDRVYAQGRQGLDRGRAYLDQGAAYAGHLAEEARAHVPNVEVGQAATLAQRFAALLIDAVRTRLPDIDDAQDTARDMAQSGRRRAGKFTDAVKSRVQDIDAGDLAKQGRKRLDRLAEDAKGYVPEGTASAMSRARKWLVG